MSQRIFPNDPRIKWLGAISLDSNDEYVMSWRIPYEEIDLYNIDLMGRAAMPAGVRLTFQSNAEKLLFSCDSLEERSPVDLFVDGEYFGTEATENRETFEFHGLSPGSKEIELWLPQYGEFRFKGLEIPDGASLAASTRPKLTKWVTYGSSITQCRDATSPRLTWPSIVSRNRGSDLTCLGYAGQCHLDPLIARVIRDNDADLISLCVGINVYTNPSMNERTFGPNIVAFIKIIREKHPLTPIAIFSPIYSPGREETANVVGFTLKGMRGEIKRSVDILISVGDKNLYYFDGLDILDAADAHLLHDGLHPNTEGYGLMAKNIIKMLDAI